MHQTATRTVELDMLYTETL